ncbi:MAG: hemerythrin domain-containing protein [Planctomycetota bacterium]|jgi:hemerythrin-like domain-containing protein
MLDPIQELMDEHRVIEQVLTALEAAAELEEISFGFYERAADFIATFADRCHHGKEEDRLFPALEKKGIPRDGGPIGVMCSEHQIGRGHVRRMRELIAGGDLAALKQTSLEYVGLLRQHIHKEDNILFPMGRNCLDASELAALRRGFDEVEQEGQYHARYTKVARELLAEVGIDA